jgi:hypothetical protein
LCHGIAKHRASTLPPRTPVCHCRVRLCHVVPPPSMTPQRAAVGLAHVGPHPCQPHPSYVAPSIASHIAVIPLSLSTDTPLPSLPRIFRAHYACRRRTSPSTCFGGNMFILYMSQIFQVGDEHIPSRDVNREFHVVG